jgi:hypothetical protein
MLQLDAYISNGKIPVESFIYLQEVLSVEK